MDRETWQDVADLFDQALALSPPERARWLASDAVDETLRPWLERLLAAHDSPRPLLVDHSVEEIVSDLIGEPDEALHPGYEGRHFGPWRAIDVIGRGGMGVVLKGERADGQFEKQVAIKVLAPASSARLRSSALRREIQLLAGLEHAGIARLLDGGTNDDGLSYLVMEYVSGEPITDFCERRTLGVLARVELLIEAAQAIAYSHSRLVVHCDIKPANVLVAAHGGVKLLDFGIAARLRERMDAADLPPFVHCTPAYAAPEQLAGHSPAVAQDIFALGALLYELLTGERIRNGAQMTRALTGDPAPTSIEPPAGLGDLGAICRKALADQPEQRYSSVESFIEDLDNWRLHLPVEARAGGVMYRCGRWLRRHYLLAGAGVAVVAALLGGTGLALWQAHEANLAAGRADREAARATSALAQTEQALARAESLSNFLSDLFRAAAPQRPRDELPSTEEILDLGARRALDETSAPEAERLGMLLTIGDIYVQRNQWAPAEPLLDAAVALARSHADDRPVDLARALYAQGRRFQALGELDKAEALLIEAEAALPEPAADWDTYVWIQSARGYIEITRGNYALARGIFERIHKQILSRPETETAIRPRERVMTGLAIVRKNTGAPESALELHDTIDQMLQGSGGYHAMTAARNLFNKGVLEHGLGRFEAAESTLLAAIELYDRTVDKPNQWRGFATRMLAYNYFQIGEFEQGMSTLTGGMEETALALDTRVEDYGWLKLDLAWVNGRVFGEHERASRATREVLEQLRGSEQQGSVLWVWAVALQAWLDCRHGRASEGTTLLATLDQTLGGNLPESSQQRSEIHEARAHCRLDSGNPQAALREIEQALEDGGAPGRVIERSAIHRLQARSFAALGRWNDAAHALERAEEVFLEHGLTSHPHLELVATLRQTLFP